VIASPPAYHLEQALLCNESKIPFLMEKNLCLVEDDFENFHKKITVPALMGYTWRFWPSLVALKGMIFRVGQIRRVEFTMAAHLEDWHPWEPVEEFYAAERGGIINEAHWHDIMLHWFGWPDKIYASIDHISDLNIPSADVLDSIFLTWEPNVTTYQNKGKAEVYENEIERNTMFMEEAEHFLKVIKGTKPICTLEDGVNVMILLANSIVGGAARLSQVITKKKESGIFVK
jgi:predicted dehydrogenase